MKESIRESMIYGYMIEKAKFTDKVDKTTNSNERIVSKDAIKQMKQSENKNKVTLKESFIIESVENEIKSAGSKEGLMKKYHLTNDDINVGKRFLSKNPKIAAKFKSCKSIKDFMYVMKDKDVQTAMNNDK